jgi:hypothetical protein
MTKVSVGLREKRCPECKKIKPVSQFGVNRARPDKTAYRCRRCTAEIALARCYAHPDVGTKQNRRIKPTRHTTVRYPSGEHRVSATQLREYEEVRGRRRAWLR